MTKSSAVLFILLFSLIFKLEEPVRHPPPASPPPVSGFGQAVGGH